MSELVCQQAAARVVVRSVLAGGKDDVVIDRVGAGAELAGGCRCARIGVQADVAQVRAEARLHEGARGGIEGVTRGAKDFVNQRR